MGYLILDDGTKVLNTQAAINAINKKAIIARVDATKAAKKAEIYTSTTNISAKNAVAVVREICEIIGYGSKITKNNVNPGGPTVPAFTKMEFANNANVDEAKSCVESIGAEIRKSISPTDTKNFAAEMTKLVAEVEDQYNRISEINSKMTELKKKVSSIAMSVSNIERWNSENPGVITEIFGKIKTVKSQNEKLSQFTATTIPNSKKDLEKFIIEIDEKNATAETLEYISSSLSDEAVIKINAASAPADPPQQQTAAQQDSTQQDSTDDRNFAQYREDYWKNPDNYDDKGNIVFSDDYFSNFFN